MSTNSECLFFRWSEDKWYYLLEDYNAPKNAWDWREHASCYGPFVTVELADTHCSDNHANPGGSCTDETIDTSDEVLAEHVKNAIPNAPRGYGYFRSY
tara:strand:+ start:235 stop:528 length:294 start_codon:yes stop_codon:yes gene_type:complete